MERLKKGEVRSTGAAAPRTVAMPVDMEAMPEDLAGAVAEQGKQYRHGRQHVEWMRQHKIEFYRRQRRTVTNLVSELRRPKRSRDADTGQRAAILETARDWITFYEIRKAMPQRSANGLKAHVAWLWARGKLLKRKNPAWTGKPGWGEGVARCIFQFKAAPLCEGDNPGK